MEIGDISLPFTERVGPHMKIPDMPPDSGGNKPKNGANQHGLAFSFGSVESRLVKNTNENQKCF